MKKFYAILRAIKIKSWIAMARLQRHHLRSGGEKETPHADPILTSTNLDLVQGKTGSFEERAKEVIGEAKVRKGAVLGIEFLAAFTHGAKIDAVEWAKDTFSWACERFGRENIISAIVHRDEFTTHMHLVMVPMVNGRLCCREILGGRDKLSAIQDSYHEAISKRHSILERGERGSKKRHVSPKLLRRQIVEAHEYQNLKQELAEEKQKTSQLIRDKQNRLRPDEVDERRRVLALERSRQAKQEAPQSYNIENMGGPIK